MKSNDIISSGLLESYVLGTCSAQEAEFVHNQCKEYPELLKEMEAIETSLIQFSAKLAPPLNEAAKQKIETNLEFIHEESPVAKVISIKNETENRLTIYKVGIAASLLLFFTSLMYNLQLNHKLSKANATLAELTVSKSYLAEELKINQASLKSMGEELKVLANPTVKTIVLKGMNSMPQQSAMIHLNMSTDEVYFNAKTLPNTPANKQYQLWAIIDGKPVDAGMIDMNSRAQVFQKMKSIKGAQAFAVTIEKMGGSAEPSMDTMCLLGNV